MCFWFKPQNSYLNINCVSSLKATLPIRRYTTFGNSDRQCVSPVVPNTMRSASCCLKIHLLTIILMELLTHFLQFQKALENLIPTRELDSTEMEGFQTAYTFQRTSRTSLSFQMTCWKHFSHLTLHPVKRKWAGKQDGTSIHLPLPSTTFT